MENLISYPIPFPLFPPPIGGVGKAGKREHPENTRNGKNGKSGMLHYCNYRKYQHARIMGFVCPEFSTQYARARARVMGYGG